MKTFRELLIEREACEPAREWAGDMTVEEVVEKCHRGDWLLWLAEEVGVEQRLLILAGGLSANTVRHLMKDELSKNAVDVYIRYGQGQATCHELVAAAHAALDAWDAMDAPGNAAAARAARDAWDAPWNAAAAAARAASWAAGHPTSKASADARAENQRQTADIARAVCGKRIVELVNQLLK